MAEPSNSDCGTSRKIFPAALRRAVPLLAAADQNPVFEAFHIRRTSRVQRSLLGKYVPLYAGHLVWTVALLIAFYVIYRLFPRNWEVALIAFVFGGFIGMRVTAKYFRKPQVLWASGVFRVNQTHRREAVDLWLTGVRGREILEAIFLEQFELRWLMLTIISTAPAAVGIVLVHLFGKALTLEGILLQVALLIFGIECARSGLVGVASYVREKNLVPRIRSWSATGFVSRVGVYREHFFSALIGLALYIILLSLLFLFMVKFGRRGVSPEDAGYLAFIKNHPTEMGALACLLISTVFLHFLRRWQVARNRRLLEALYDQADRIFEFYMRREVLEDADAASEENRSAGPGGQCAA